MIRIEVNRFICRCWFSVNFYFEVLIGSVQKKIQNIEEGISFRYKFELQSRVNITSIMQDPCGGDFCVIEIDPNIVDTAGVENNMITLLTCIMTRYSRCRNISASKNDIQEPISTTLEGL